MDLPSSKNKSVYNVPEELAPDRAEFITYAGEFWKKEDGNFVEILEKDIPSGSDVFVISTSDVAKSTPTDIEGLTIEQEEEHGLVEHGEGFIPGVVGASSQEGVVNTTAIPGSGEAHGEQDLDEEE